MAYGYLSDGCKGKAGMLAGFLTAEGRVKTMDDAEILTFAMSKPGDIRSMAASLVNQTRDRDEELGD
jgi:hypothetical protein